MRETSYKHKKFPMSVISDEIKKLVKAAQEDRVNLVEERNERYRKDLEFWKITIDKDMLFYYLRNDRTLGDCRQYIEKVKASENLPSDFFALKNTEDIAAQEGYHQIIYRGAAVDTIVDQYVQQGKQCRNDSDRLYITTDGIVGNGNTRLSVIREKMKDWRTVECLVWEEQYKDDWRLIENHTSVKDNAPDFRQPNPWYGKADTYKKYQEEEDMSDAEIAREMNYFTGGQHPKPDVKKLLKDVALAELADHFLNHNKTDEYETFDDLRHMGGQSTYGKQVFTTLQARQKSFEKIQPEIKKELQMTAYHAMSYGIKGEARDMHRAIGTLYTTEHVTDIRLRNAEDENLKFTREKWDKLTLEEKDKKVEKTLLNSQKIETDAKDAKEVRYSQNLIKSVIHDLERANRNIKPSSVVDQIEDHFKDIADQIEAIKQKIKELKI